MSAHPGKTKPDAGDAPGFKTLSRKENVVTEHFVSQPRWSGNEKICRRRAGRIDFAAINRAAAPLLPSIVMKWLPSGKRVGHEWQALNPRRHDRSLGSFSVNLNTGAFADFATGDKGGDIIALAAYLHGISQAEAARKLADALGIDPRRA